MSRTRFTGTTPLVSIPDMRPSGRNRYYEENISMPYGNPLAGLPLRRPSLVEDDDSARLASKLDDNVGNGIFDGSNAPPIQNAGNGVFECDWSEPGYLYRERLTRESSVTDRQTGQPIVSLPAGGSWPNHLAHSYRPWDDETPRLYATGETDLTKAAGERPVWEWAVAGAVAGVVIAVASKFMGGK